MENPKQSSAESSNTKQECRREYTGGRDRLKYRDCGVIYESCTGIKEHDMVNLYRRVKAGKVEPLNKEGTG